MPIERVRTTTAATQLRDCPLEAGLEGVGVELEGVGLGAGLEDAWVSRSG